MWRALPSGLALSQGGDSCSSIWCGDPGEVRGANRLHVNNALQQGVADRKPCRGPSSANPPPGMRNMIGVFGGSGFYDFLDDPQRVAVDTPYGLPSADFAVGSFDGVDVAFLPRHGVDHQFPAHRVPFRANAWAMKELGVDRVIAPCAAGSLQRHIKPGHFVISNQLVDRTWGRANTFFDGPETVHLSFADPYCLELRPAALEACRLTGAESHDGGTVVVIQGPRFSTRAESAEFARSGWDIINMTQAPEAQLIRELGLCYVNIAVVTDYDTGVEGEIEPVTHAAVLEQFRTSLGTLRDVLALLIPLAAETTRECECAGDPTEAVEPISRPDVD